MALKYLPASPESRACAMLAFGGSYHDAMAVSGLSLEQVKRAWAQRSAGRSKPQAEQAAAPT